MVKTIIVMSDSHGDRQIVEAIKSRYEREVDAIFHNGDSELLASDHLWQGIQVVRGNCDWERFPDHLVTKVGTTTVAQTHGHLFGINYGWDRLDYWAEEAGADICLYGHLHVPDAQVRGGILFLNPGSVSHPRGLIRECLYAKITVSQDSYHIEFLNRNHEIYSELTRDIGR